MPVIAPKDSNATPKRRTVLRKPLENNSLEGLSSCESPDTKNGEIASKICEIISMIFLPVMGKLIVTIIMWIKLGTCG